MKRLGFRSRLLVILALFAFVPAIVLTVAWGATIVGFLGQIDGAAAWEQAASTGGATITIARRGARSATDSAVISAHEQELTRSLTNAERFGFLSRQGGVALLVLGTLLLAILTFLASRAAGHLSRQLSRPLTELVRWTALIRRGEPLPTSDGRGAPEFEVLRSEMRQMEVGLAAGRQAAIEAERLEAFRESARQVAHELKNPLTPISLSADRIARQLERSSTSPEFARIVRDCTRIIQEEVVSVKSLVDEFSQFARFPAAQPQPSDLNEVVESALAVFSGRLEGITMHKSLADGLPVVNLDREQFKRVVVNLIDNAAEAMKDVAWRHLAITTHAPTADTVELVVADSGCGISAEDREKLFLPYFSTKERGTGLGLAIVAHILTDHGAQIRVEDNTPSGARFTIEVPAAVGNLTTAEVRA